ncbi:MAG: MGMT family protein [Candidatus Nealsonbacteria bacterium]
MNSFQEKVYEAVKKIPRGKVLSYKKIAYLAGSPKAFRAVGNILNKNRNKKVPCHRVVKSNGEVNGYRLGSKKKIALLKKEGVIIKENKTVI